MPPRGHLQSTPLGMLHIDASSFSTLLYPSNIRNSYPQRFDFSFWLTDLSRSWRITWLLLSILPLCCRVILKGVGFISCGYRSKISSWLSNRDVHSSTIFVHRLVSLGPFSHTLRMSRFSVERFRKVFLWFSRFVIDLTVCRWFDWIFNVFVRLIRYYPPYPPFISNLKERVPS